MQINVRLHGLLRWKLARETKGYLTVELPQGATINDVLEALGVKILVKCSLNGEIERDFTRQLQEGDEVSFFQPSGGG